MVCAPLSLFAGFAAIFYNETPPEFPVWPEALLAETGQSSHPEAIAIITVAEELECPIRRKAKCHFRPPHGMKTSPDLTG